MKHVEAVQAAPPASVVGLSLFGYPLAEWVYVATLIYTIFLLIDKFPVVVCRVKQLTSLVKGNDDESNCR